MVMCCKVLCVAFVKALVRIGHLLHLGSSLVIPSLGAILLLNMQWHLAMTLRSPHIASKVHGMPVHASIKNCPLAGCVQFGAACKNIRAGVLEEPV